MSAKRRGRAARCAAGAVLWLLLAAYLFGLPAGQSSAAPRGAQSATTPLTPAPAPNAPRSAAPLIPAQPATGICQCITDHSRRHIGCLSSVDECRTSCDTDRYSFVPNAPSCPATAQGGQ